MLCSIVPLSVVFKNQSSRKKVKKLKKWRSMIFAPTKQVKKCFINKPMFFKQLNLYNLTKLV